MALHFQDLLQEGPIVSGPEALNTARLILIIHTGKDESSLVGR